MQYILSVSEVNKYLKGIISKDVLLSNLWVRGEISNIKQHSSGHVYFTLKDENSLIKCVMFKSYAAGLAFLPENGMRVLVKGYVSVYERDGQYQLYSEEMQPDGIGALHVAFEQLKERLKDEEKCIVVSTSLIEAGVDVDFPVVYRAMCGLDSIIQAAGRCNRERRNELAYLYVFDFTDEEFKVNKSSPYGNYLRQRQSITEIVADMHEDVTRPEAIKRYFDMLFSNASVLELDKKHIVKKLNEGFDWNSPLDFYFDFEDIAHDFKLIEDNDYSVIIKYNDDAKMKISELEYGYYSREKLRSLQKYTVNLTYNEYYILKEINAVKGLGEKIGVLISREDYSDEIGIKIPEQLGIAEFT